MDTFETIKTARSFIGGLSESQASDKTLLAYGVEFERILKKANGKMFDILPIARMTTSAATWYRRKAAIQHILKQNITGLLKHQDQLQRVKNQTPEQKKEWEKVVRQLGKQVKLAESFKNCEELPRIPPRKKRSGQKKSLSGLPQDWREKISGRLIKYKSAFLIAAATGCRPAELAHGVKIKTVIGGDIVITINGSKLSEFAGQESRTLTIAADGVDGSIASQLIALGETTVKIDDEKAFSCAIRDAGRREYKDKKTDLTAYSLRHQFASDRKAEDWPTVEISKMLGHATEKTASYYGTRNQARGGCGVKITSIEASREVKPKSVSKKKPSKIKKV